MDLNMVGHDFLCAFPRVGGASCIRQLGTRSPRGDTYARWRHAFLVRTRILRQLLDFITRENAPLARLIMYLSQSLCVLYNHNLNKCCTAKNNDTSAFYTHFRSDFQDSIPERNKKSYVVRNWNQKHNMHCRPKGIEVAEVSCWLDLM